LRPKAWRNWPARASISAPRRKPGSRAPRTASFRSRPPLGRRCDACCLCRSEHSVPPSCPTCRMNSPRRCRHPQRTPNAGPRSAGSRISRRRESPRHGGIPAGEKLDINGVVIIPLGINNPSGGAEANQFSFELAYDTGSGQRGEQLNVIEGIVFTITNPPDASGRWSRIAKSCRSNSGRSKTVTSHLPQSNAFAMIVLGIALAHAQAVWSGC
jgi:hypothetical protein